MSLRSPSRNTILPLRIQERLNGMYARATGFSGPQILDFFSRYGTNIESYPSVNIPSRKAIFEDCLSRFGRDKQLEIVRDLLDYDGPMKHGVPTQEDIHFVRAWLFDQGVVSTQNKKPKLHTRPSTATELYPVMQQDDPAEWDIFLSHASEDKEDFARPLAHALRNQGLRVWFDEFTLRVGDSLRRSIDMGLSRAKYGVVIISPAFLSKEWPKKELDGLVAREMSGEKVVLPVWHNLDESLLRHHSPLLADRLATSSRKGMDKVVADLLDAIGNSPGNSPHPGSPNFPRPHQRITNGIGMEFVLIPAGSFTMGSRMNPKELVDRFGGKKEWYGWEKPSHSVKIERPFYLQNNPVTQGQWQCVMGNNPSIFRDCGDNCPVEKVSWEDIQLFIEKLNQVEKMKNYRLPSEAEWEYACRAGSEEEFFFGDDEKRLGEFAWYATNSEDKTHPVGGKKPNPWGLNDMHGNVWEWVEDDWHNSYQGAPNDGRAWVNNPRHSYRLFRGGSWGYDAQGCRSAMRSSGRISYRGFDVGFRLAKPVELGP